MTEIGFTKYHGTGNDFVMVVDLDDEHPIGSAAVAAICDRRTGIGADGLIRVVDAGDGARFFMDYTNADGSAAEMCGNGIRCVGKLVHDLGLIDPDDLEIDVLTRAGRRHLQLHADPDGVVRRVTVYMGPASFTKASIPMRGPAWEAFLQQPMEVGPGLVLEASAVSMGNPHLVLFLDDDPDRFHVGHIGPALEHHELFPEGTNVEFAQVKDDHIKVRVWERGSGETMACGSGACAVAVAANEAGLVPTSTSVRFPGGDVEVTRTADEVMLTGAAERVFSGTIGVELARSNSITG